MGLILKCYPVLSAWQRRSRAEAESYMAAEKVMDYLKNQETLVLL